MKVMGEEVLQAGEGTDTSGGGCPEVVALRAECAARGGTGKGAVNRGTQMGWSLLLQWEGASRASLKWRPGKQGMVPSV